MRKRNQVVLLIGVRARLNTRKVSLIDVLQTPKKKTVEKMESKMNTDEEDNE